MRVLVNDRPDKPHAQAGQVLDLPDQEAKQMIAVGAAVAAPDAPDPDPVPRAPHMSEDPPAELPGAPEPDPGPEPELATNVAATTTTARAPRAKVAATKTSKKG